MASDQTDEMTDAELEAMQQRWIEAQLARGARCICGKPRDMFLPADHCGHIAPNQSKHTPTADCRCADCIAYDESSPL